MTQRGAPDGLTGIFGIRAKDADAHARPGVPEITPRRGDAKKRSSETGVEVLWQIHSTGVTNKDDSDDHSGSMGRLA